jgi:hypothetical protein
MSPRNHSPDPQERGEEASGSGSRSSGGQEEKKDAHFHAMKHAYNDTRFRSKELTSLHSERESKAVKDWEAKNVKAMEEETKNIKKES